MFPKKKTKIRWCVSVLDYVIKATFCDIKFYLSELHIVYLFYLTNKATYLMMGLTVVKVLLSGKLCGLQNYGMQVPELGFPVTHKDIMNCDERHVGIYCLLDAINKWKVL